MAMRGAYLYTGYIAGRGTVRVFQDLDNPSHVFAMLKSGQSIYTTRDRIAARRASKPSEAVPPVGTPDSTPKAPSEAHSPAQTLF